jgi:para-nitrobenzyl esterase
VTVIETTSGRVRGRSGPRGRAFLGLPYAAPPVGERRFAAPAAVEPWTGVRDATRAGPAPPQPDRPIGALVFDGRPATSEDCLTLNVWTPAEPGEQRPVLVWVHGGGFAIGWGADPVYHGARLAAAADAVVVTLSYRLGSLGWLWHPALAEADGAPAGNWGLLDQLAALRWVRENAPAFGGDPERVTLAGQSAGADSVLALLGADAAEGLFGRAILQSPVLPAAETDVEGARRWAEALAEAVAGPTPNPDVAADHPPSGDPGPAPPDLLDRIRAAPADAVVAAHEALLADPRLRGLRGPWPTLDRATLPAVPTDEPGVRADIPVLVGATADEASFFFGAPGRRVDPDEDELRTLVGRLPSVDDADAVVAAYREDAAERGAPADGNALLVAIATDALVAVPGARWARERAAAGGSVHAYRVEHRCPVAGLGATHCVELALVFGTYADGGAATRLSGDGPEAAGASAAMMRAWAAFIRGEDPGWAPVDAGAATVQTAVFGGAAPLRVQARPTRAPLLAAAGA